MLKRSTLLASLLTHVRIEMHGHTWLLSLSSIFLQIALKFNGRRHLRRRTSIKRTILLLV
jgi:hypothetical protein